MTSLDVEYRRSGRSWQAILGGGGLTMLVLLTIASTRITSIFPTRDYGEPLEVYYKPPPAPPAVQQAPLPKSSKSENSFSFDFALKEEPTEISLKTLDVQLNHDLGASVGLQLELQRKFEASRPQVGDFSDFIIYERGEVDTKPYAVFSPQPDIPYSLRRFEVEVVAFYFVSSTGRPDRISILSSTSEIPTFADAARDIIAKWRFKPAKKNGRAVNCWVQQTIRYQKGSTSPFSL